MRQAGDVSYGDLDADFTAGHDVTLVGSLGVVIIRSARRAIFLSQWFSGAKSDANLDIRILPGSGAPRDETAG
jgi:hypothetical protein